MQLADEAARKNQNTDNSANILSINTQNSNEVQ
jgi:hypothetical protein